MECEAREDYYRTQRGIQKMLEQNAAKIETLTAENKSLAVENESLATENETLTAEIEKLHNWTKTHGYDAQEI